MSDRVNFFGLSDESIIYDERKRRFVSTSNMPGYMERGLKNANFKDVSYLFKI